MKIYKVLVDELPIACGSRTGKHDPKPCDFFMVANPLWCFVTDKSIEENNNPYESRPSWCPLQAVSMWEASYSESGIIKP